jgi:hypothetical protein
VLSVCAVFEFEVGINWMIAWFLEINFAPRLDEWTQSIFVYKFLEVRSAW